MAGIREKIAPIRATTNPPVAIPFDGCGAGGGGVHEAGGGA
jgi:hypothetical protein